MTTITDMVKDLVCWEDVGTFPIIAMNEDGKIIVTDSEWYDVFVADTFEEALKLLIKTEKEQTKIKEENLLLNWKTMLKKNSAN